MKLLILVSFLSVLALFSCNDATTNPDGDAFLYPFSTDVIRPLSVGNYWVYDFVVNDTLSETIHVNVVDSTNKTYDGKSVSVFTIKSENKEIDNSTSFTDYFIVGNTTYHTENTAEKVITECEECIPYRYVGDAKAQFVEEEYTFDGRLVTALKRISDDSYFVIGVGWIKGGPMPIREPKSLELSTVTSKLTDYHINR